MARTEQEKEQEGHYMTSPPRRASAASAKARRSDCTRHRSRAVLTVVCDAKGAADANRDSLVGQSHGRNLGQVRAALRFGARGARFGAGSRGRGPSLALRYDRECARRVCAAELSAERLGPWRRRADGGRGRRRSDSSEVVEEPPRRWKGARRFRELARGRRAPDYVGAWRVLRPRGLKMRFF